MARTITCWLAVGILQSFKPAGAITGTQSSGLYVGFRSIACTHGILEKPLQMFYVYLYFDLKESLLSVESHKPQ